MEKETNQQYVSEDEISLSEIISILWKRKLLIVILPIMAAIIAFTASQFLTPTYNSTVKLSLGNLGHQMYTNVDTAEQVLLSRDLLRPIMDQLNLEYETANNFRQIINVKKLPTTMLEVEVSYHDPDKVQQIAQMLADGFIKKAEPIFLEKKGLMEQRYQSTLTQYEKVGESINRNKEAITRIETNQALTNAEKDLSRARLIDYIMKDEILFNSLEGTLQQLELQLLDVEKAVIFEEARVPLYPSSPNKLLNTAIGLVIGVMVAIGLSFLLEYLKANPIRLNDDQAS